MTRLAVVLALLLCGCGADPDCLGRVAPEPLVDFVAAVAPSADGQHLTVRYAGGFETVVPRGPRRIVSTLPGLTELVAYLGATDRLVGVSPHCDRPAAVASLQRVGVMPLDFEAILALDADLVLVDRSLFRSQLGELKQHVAGLLALETSRSLPHLAASVELLAEVLATPEAGRAARGFRRDLEALTTRIAAAAPDSPPRVLIVSVWDPLNVIGPGALIDDCVRICGGINVACDLRLPSGDFDEELVVTRRPDWILHRAAAPPPALRARWSDVPGVAPGRLGSCESDELSRGGPRILGALARLAAVLHGEAPIETLAGDREIR